MKRYLGEQNVYRVCCRLRGSTITHQGKPTDRGKADALVAFLSAACSQDLLFWVEAV